MSYRKFPSSPGIYKDDSPLEAKLFWTDADKIRFERELPETIYGWERASIASVLGYCRGLHTWADNSKNPFAAIGTHLRLYAMDADGTVNDITPVASRGFATSISFTTVNGSPLVTAAWTSHGLVQDQKVLLENATTSPVGGISINGTFVASSITDANTVVLTATSSATSGAGPTASTVDWSVYLAPGLADGLGGLGFGTGGFGSGGFGGSSSVNTLFVRSYSLTHWGQNLIANPRGGGIYEWAPNVSASELVTNGTFTGSATGWTTGTGWAYGTNNIVATAATGDLSQNITLPPAAWCLLKTNVSAYTSGSVQPKVSGSAVGSALNAVGKSAASFFSGSGGTVSIAMSPSTASLTLDDISVQVETYGNLIPNAPVQVTCTFVTAERIMVAAGCTSPAGSFDPMLVRWSDQEDNQDWTATATNMAGSYPLSNGSRIVRGLPGSRENVILTDTALYAMRNVPDPNVIYEFVEIADKCGLIGPNAVASLFGNFYWMSNNGEFYVYDGSVPSPLTCTLGRDVRDNLAWVQQDKIYAFTVAARNEVWWLIPDSRDGVECSRYVAYNVVGQNWTAGNFNRTAWTDAGIYQYPISVDTVGAIWFQEKGLTQDGGPRQWSLTSAYFDLSDGDDHMRILGMQPDAAGLQGGYTVTIQTRSRSSTGILTRTFGPYNVTAASGKVSVRASGQEARLIFAGNAAPTYWRLGALRLDIQSTNQRR